jgi:hypothetical protein
MHLCRIGDWWYFRLRIPRDVARHFPCREIKKALRTGDLKRARARVNVLSFETERIFTLIRSRLLTDSQIEQLVRDFYNTTLKEVEEERALGYSIPADEDALDDALEAHDWFISEYKEALALNKIKIIEPQVKALLSVNSIELYEDSAEYKKLSRELLKTSIEVLKVERERLTGNYANEFDRVLHPPLRNQGQPIRQEKRLSEVVDEYIREKQAKNDWNAKTALDNASIHVLFCNAMRLLSVQVLQ